MEPEGPASVQLTRLGGDEEAPASSVSAIGRDLPSPSSPAEKPLAQRSHANTDGSDSEGDELMDEPASPYGQIGPPISRVQTTRKPASRCCYSADGTDLLEVYCPKFIILPSNGFKALWDLGMIVTLFAVLIYAPYQIAWVDPGSDSAFNLTITVLFAVDMLLAFFSAFYDERTGVLVDDKRKIAHAYLTGWFVIDFVSTFPWSVVAQSSEGGLAQMLRLTKLARLLRVARLTQILRNSEYGQRVLLMQYNPRLHPSTFRILRLIFALLAYTHVFACLWYWIGEAQDPDKNPPPWIYRLYGDEEGPIKELSVGSQYLISIYFIVTTLTTVGYGDLTPRTNVEMGFVTFVEVCGATFFAYLMGTLASIISSVDAKESTFRTKMSQLVLFLGGYRKFISQTSQDKLIAEMSYHWKHDIAQTAEEQAEFLRLIPVESRKVLLYEELFKPLLEHCSLFKLQTVNQNQDFMLELLGHMLPIRYSDGKVITRKDRAISDLKFVYSGHVEVYAKLRSAPETDGRPKGSVTDAMTSKVTHFLGLRGKRKERAKSSAVEDEKDTSAKVARAGTAASLLESEPDWQKTESIGSRKRAQQLRAEDLFNREDCYLRLGRGDVMGTSAVIVSSADVERVHDEEAKLKWQIWSAAHHKVVIWSIPLHTFIELINKYSLAAAVKKWALANEQRLIPPSHLRSDSRAAKSSHSTTTAASALLVSSSSNPSQESSDVAGLLREVLSRLTSLEQRVGTSPE